MKNLLTKKNLKFIIPGLAVLLIAGIAAALALRGGGETSYGEYAVTRSQWVQSLAAALDCGAPNSAEPFFTDVAAENNAFACVQAAVAYRWLDPGAREFQPNEPATRAFVAATAARAVGLVGTPEADLKDISGQPDPDGIRLAVDSGIFDCPDGLFDPDGTLTLNECLAVLDKVKALTTIAINPNHEDVLTLKKDVVDLRHLRGAVTYRDSAAFSLTVASDEAAALAVGSVYVLPPSARYPYGVARKVAGIAPDGDTYIIENSIPSLDEVIGEIDVQGVYYPDYDNIKTAAGVTWTLIPDGGAAPAMAAGTYRAQPLSATEETLSSGTLALEVKVEEGDIAVVGAVSLQLGATVYIKKGLLGGINELAVTVTENHEAALSVKVSREVDIPLAVIPIPVGPTGIAVMIDVSLNASGEVVISLVNTAAAEYGVRLANLRPSVFARCDMSFGDVETEASVKVGLKPAADLEILGLELGEVSIFIGAGLTAATAPSVVCTDLSLYGALEVEAQLLPQLEIVEIAAK
ncbi:MAG: hypothetical protein LBI54_06165, partial [Lachnospiraceae bacterium]|nr:hypothetical protein [Lachnospiraceae bacterium]